MANPSQIVSQINLLVTTPQGVPESQFKSTAQAFAQLCKEVNERLTRVEAYLAMGLRTEALYTAEIEPNIVSLCKAIEQARADDWARVCGEHDLERAAPIHIEGLKRLRDAAATEHTLKPLLKRHRRLALSQAPIKERLEVLRELAKTDPASPIWEQDVKSFESARISELTPLLKQPGSVTELARAQDLIRELTDGTWRTKVPQELLDNARRAVQRLQSIEALKDIKALMPKLHEAHAAKDINRVRTLMNDLNEITEARGVPMPAEVQTQLLNVHEWVAREEIKHAKRREFDDACTALRAALDRRADVVEINQAWMAARSFDLALPDELEREAQLRIRTHEQAKRRRTQLVVAVIVLTVGGIMAGVAHQLRERSANAKIKEVQQQVETALAGNKFDTAQGAIDALAKENPALAKRQEVESLKTLLAKKIADENQRRQDFKTLYAEATSKGADEPDPQVIDKLQKLAVDEEEKEKLTVYLRDVDTAREVRQEGIDLIFRQQATALSKELKPISETRADTDPTGLAADLVKYDKRFAELDENKRVSENARILLEPARGQLRALHAAIKSVSTRKETDTAFKAALESLADSVWSPTQHKQRLDAIHDEFPTNSRADSLKNAALQVNAWVAVQKWSQLSEEWQKKLVPDRSNVAERIRAVDDYILKNPNTPLIAAATEYLAYLRVAQTAFSDKGPWRDEYKRVLANPLMRELSRVKITNGKTYYLIQGEGNPRSNNVGTSISAIVSSDINKPISLEFKPGFAGKTEPAPQATFAKTWLARISEFQDLSWDTFGLEALHAVTVQPDLDPIVRLLLIHRTLTPLRKVAWGIEDVDSLARKVESKVASDDSTWLNPDDAEAQARRAAAVELLGNLPSFDALIQTVKSKRRAMFKPLQFEVVSNAVALQNGTEWRILQQSKDTKELKNGQRLLITADKGKTLREIGTVVNGKPTVDLTRMIGVDEGTLIFICDTKSD